MAKIACTKFTFLVFACECKKHRYKIVNKYIHHREVRTNCSFRKLPYKFCKFVIMILSHALLLVIVKLQKILEHQSCHFFTHHQVQSGVNPSKLFFHKTKIFFRFSLLSLAHLQQRLCSYVTNTQAVQQKSENKEKQSLVGLTLEVNATGKSAHQVQFL